MGIVYFICNSCEKEFATDDNENTSYDSREQSLCKKCFDWQKDEAQYFKEQEDRYYDEYPERREQDES